MFSQNHLNLTKKWETMLSDLKRRLTPSDYEGEELLFQSFHLDSYVGKALLKKNSIEEIEILAKEWYDITMRMHFVTHALKTEYKKDLERVQGVKKRNEFFITVGFDDKNITIDKIKKCVKGLKEMSCGILEHMTIEKFRKDDSGKIYEHHHIHFIFCADYAKSKVLQFVYQKVQKYVQSKNFVDIKECTDVRRKYVLGEKKSEKMECVELDKKWRSENNLGEFIF